MLTVWVATKRSARFYDEYVGRKGQTYQKFQKFLSETLHIRITSLLREVANHRFSVTVHRQYTTFLSPWQPLDTSPYPMLSYSHG